MKTQRTILLAFLLNTAFAVFEFVGGILIGSVAIASDALHDAGDALSIGIAYFLEKKSIKQPDEQYTYGYGRYAVVGGLITSLVLLGGSVVMIVNAVSRWFSPTPIDYTGMIGFAAVGIVVNTCAVFFTRRGESINQKAVNLHMLEDVLGWVVVLIGAIVMRLTNFSWIDSLLSIGVSVFILVHAVGTLRDVAELFLEKVPHGISVEELKAHVCQIDGVRDVHHIHLWSMDGRRHYATMHLVTEGDPYVVKATVRRELQAYGIGHVTIETEATHDSCTDAECRVQHDVQTFGHAHHHHE